MPFYLPANIHSASKIMVFIDGENLAIRYKALIAEGKTKQDHVTSEQDVFVWTEFANVTRHNCDILRRYYYTCVTGDDNLLTKTEDRLKALGIEAPRVFKKPKSRSSKQVDISLTTDMLSHAHRKNFDLAILVAGDKDYIPLVEAVMAEGCRVALWFFGEGNGLNPDLKRKVDHFFDIGEFFFQPEEYLTKRY